MNLARPLPELENVAYVCSQGSRPPVAIVDLPPVSLSCTTEPKKEIPHLEEQKTSDRSIERMEEGRAGHEVKDAERIRMLAKDFVCGSAQRHEVHKGDVQLNWFGSDSEALLPLQRGWCCRTGESISLRFEISFVPSLALKNCYLS